MTQRLDACPGVPDESAVLLRVRRTDLALLRSAVAETIEALGEWEFELRTGAKKAEFADLLGRLIAARVRVSPEA
jgi:hypothetical protein